MLKIGTIIEVYFISQLKDFLAIGSIREIISIFLKWG